MVFEALINMDHNANRIVQRLEGTFVLKRTFCHVFVRILRTVVC